jgi:hypothetical protein
LKPFGLEQQAQGFENVRLIVGDQDPGFAWPDWMPDAFGRFVTSAAEMVGDQHRRRAVPPSEVGVVPTD